MSSLERSGGHWCEKPCGFAAALGRRYAVDCVAPRTNHVPFEIRRLRSLRGHHRDRLRSGSGSLFLTLLTRVLSGQQNHLVRRICCKAGNSRCPSPAELVAIAT